MQTLERFGQFVDLELARLRTPSWALRPVKDELVRELERSIKANGLLQPIVVRAVRGGYEIVFGNHRVEACRRLGLMHIRAIIREFTEEEAFLARASENLVRNSYVDPIEEAEGYRMLIGKGWTINAIAHRIGKCDSYVCERLALLERLDSKVLTKLADRKLTASHAELISRIPDPSRQNELAELVAKKRLSVRSLERMLSRAPPPTKVCVETISNNFYVRIPQEYSQIIGLRDEDQLFLYMRGKKIILETGERYRASSRKALHSHRG
jgi:ParB family transcriptional regulator, chromosome partitioning protein